MLLHLHFIENSQEKSIFIAIKKENGGSKGKTENNFPSKRIVKGHPIFRDN